MQSKGNTPFQVAQCVPDGDRSCCGDADAGTEAVAVTDGVSDWESVVVFMGVPVSPVEPTTSCAESNTVQSSMQCTRTIAEAAWTREH